MTDDADRFAEAFGVSRETRDRLTRYADLLKKWNPAINLVSRTTLPHLWTRHFADSAQLLEIADTASGTWADLGSGGGFPGMIVAILAGDKAPALKVTCVESDQRKATFLRTVARETGTDVTVLSERIESVQPLGAQVVSARALAPLPELVGYANRHLAPEGCALFLKGTGQAQEIDQALASWSFQIDTFPSRTDSGAAILKLRSIRRV